MDRTKHDGAEQLIDLGAASVETKGAVHGTPDIGGLPQKSMGIADD